MVLKLKRSYVFIILFLICLVLFFSYLTRLPNYLNDDVYYFAKQEVKGIIISTLEDSKYNYVEVSGIKKNVLISINKTIYKKGFSKQYTYEVGDSIIKKANSKEFVIKKGDKIAVYLLNCDD